MIDNRFKSQRVSDAEWQTLRHYFCRSKPSKGRPPRDHRRVLDGIFWIASTGSAWRHLPVEYGKWGSVYRQFLRWSRNEIWNDILEDLNAGITNGTGEFDPDGDGHELTEEQRLRLLARLEAVRGVGDRPRSQSASLKKHRVAESGVTCHSR